MQRTQNPFSLYNQDPRYKKVDQKYLPSQSYMAPKNNPSAEEQRKQARWDNSINNYTVGGGVQVVPRTGPISMATPMCWPPLPPQYVPRPGTLVPLPFVSTFQPSEQPQPHLHGPLPVIKRAARIQPAWINNNPGKIDVRMLEDSPANEITVNKAYQPWGPH